MTMSHDTPNYCSGYGALVGASREVPARPEEFVWPSLEVPTFGCNHLVCSACGAALKNQGGFAHGVDHAADLPLQLYDASDWQPFVERRALVRDANIRMYVCRCQMHGAAGGTKLDDTYYDDYTTPAPSTWSCHGHPKIMLPVVLDGESIDVDTDWGALVRGAFAGLRATARPLYLRYDPAHWVERLYFGLLHTPFAPAIIEAVRVATGDPDPAVAKAAALFWQRVAPRPGRPPGED